LPQTIRSFRSWISNTERWTQDQRSPWEQVNILKLRTLNSDERSKAGFSNAGEAYREIHRVLIQRFTSRTLLLTDLDHLDEDEESIFLVANITYRKDRELGKGRFLSEAMDSYEQRGQAFTDCDQALWAYGFGVYRQLSA
jgi:hypothetical protein